MTLNTRAILSAFGSHFEAFTVISFTIWLFARATCHQDFILTVFNILLLILNIIMFHFWFKGSYVSSFNNNSSFPYRVLMFFVVMTFAALTSFIAEEAGCKAFAIHFEALSFFTCAGYLRIRVFVLQLNLIHFLCELFFLCNILFASSSKFFR